MKKPIFSVKRCLVDPSMLLFVIMILIGLFLRIFDIEIVKTLSHIIIIISIIGIAIEILLLKAYIIIVYDNYMVVERWVITREEEKILIKNLTSVKITETIFGRIFNYGDVEFTICGKEKMLLPHIKNAKFLKEYLDNLMLQ